MDRIGSDAAPVVPTSAECADGGYMVLARCAYLLLTPRSESDVARIRRAICTGQSAGSTTRSIAEHWGGGVVLDNGVACKVLTRR